MTRKVEGGFQPTLEDDWVAATLDDLIHYLVTNHRIEEAVVLFEAKSRYEELKLQRKQSTRH